MKKIYNKRRVFIPLLSVLISIMCFSIGFSMWNLTGGDIYLVEGTINSDEYVDNYIPTDCFENIGIDLNSAKYLGMSSENGFLRADNTFSLTSEDLTFNATFLLSTANTIVESLFDGGNTCTFNIGLKAGSYSFTSSNMTFTLVSMTGSAKITFGEFSRSKDSENNTVYNKYDVPVTIGNSYLNETSISFAFKIRLSASSQSIYKAFFTEAKKSFGVTLFVE